MDINLIVQKGKKIIKPNEIERINAANSMMISTFIACIILIVIGVFIFENVGGLYGWIASVILFAFYYFWLRSFNIKFNNKMAKYQTDLEEWKNETNRYITSLPIEKREVLYIKIEPEIGSNIRDVNSYSSSRDIKRTPITVSYKDEDDVITETKWYETTMLLTDEEKPFIEYQTLSKDLGHGIKAGVYNSKIHLPKPYSII